MSSSVGIVRSPPKLDPNVLQDLTSDQDEYDLESDPFLGRHLALLKSSENISHDTFNLEEIRTTPLFSMSVKYQITKRVPGLVDPFPQYGLLAGRIDSSSRQTSGSATRNGESVYRAVQDPRIFLNVGAPWSVFICGSQGSGKSHSLSCVLENCLIPNVCAGQLPNPLTGLVFHYDSFTSAVGGHACEAAYLCSSGIKVTVLVSPSNFTRMKSLYQNLPGLAGDGPKVEPLLLQQRYLNIERLMTLMAVDSTEGQVPLYIQVVYKILREMAREPNPKPGIDYHDFKRRILTKDLTSAQLGPLNLRLDLLESFIAAPNLGSEQSTKGNDWTSSPGKLIIVDLSCPFVNADSACALFEICLGVFLEQKMDTGRIVALDEAHKVGDVANPRLRIVTNIHYGMKFLRESAAAQKLTESLITTVRLQRHLACRVIIATQEPTISPKLLDLCSFTLVHRFTSPDWMKALKSHLAAASMDTSTRTESDMVKQLFVQIVNLNAGEALLFAPSAVLDVENVADQDEMTRWRLGKLGISHLKVRVRHRLTSDGGKSVLAI